MNKKISIFRCSTNWKFALRKLPGSFKKFRFITKELDCIYCVVDLHAITSFQNPEDLKKCF